METPKAHVFSWLTTPTEDSNVTAMSTKRKEAIKDRGLMAKLARTSEGRKRKLVERLASGETELSTNSLGLPPQNASEDHYGIDRGF
jgi:hypothetical protein